MIRNWGHINPFQKQVNAPCFSVGSFNFRVVLHKCFSLTPGPNINPGILNSTICSIYSTAYSCTAVKSMVSAGAEVPKVPLDIRLNYWLLCSHSCMKFSISDDFTCPSAPSSGFYIAMWVLCSSEGCFHHIFPLLYWSVGLRLKRCLTLNHNTHQQWVLNVLTRFSDYFYLMTVI